jgi:peptidoglycan-associated lipoprotein
MSPSLNSLPLSPLTGAPRRLSTARRWSRSVAVLAVAASLAACGSSVKLDEVPVEDRSTGSLSNLPQVPQAPQGGSASTDPRGGVSGVDINANDAAQPAGLARTIYFDYDSFDVRPEFRATLEAHARYLGANRSRRVALEGHTDERGGREYNLALGQKRAEAVRRSLSLLGVAESQMEAVSFGEEKPAMMGLDEASFARNRRVEFTYR